MSKIIIFSEIKQKIKTRKNYRNMLNKMTDYHEVVNYKASNEQILLNAVIDIENKRAAGQINELNEIIA